MTKENSQSVVPSHGTILLLHILDGLATIVLGLGLYSYLVENPFTDFPYLSEPNVTIALILGGAIGSTVLSLVIIKLKKARFSKFTEGN